MTYERKSFHFLMFLLISIATILNQHKGLFEVVIKHGKNARALIVAGMGQIDDTLSLLFIITLKRSTKRGSHAGD